MHFKILQHLQRGDKVAIVSPASGQPFLYPWVYELGIQRVQEVLHLEPVEFPTARQSPEYLSKNPQARAEDINAAFADPSIKAIVATIGGNDQIRILPYLDTKVISENPKIFMGYSDNTNLHIFLWNLGIPSCYGGAIMKQFAMPGGMHAYTIDALKKALFQPAIGQIFPAPERTDADLDWGDRVNLSEKSPLYHSESWHWHNPTDQIVRGRLWGGCLEVLDLHLSVKRYLPSLEQFDNIVLYLETSEEMPSEGFVYRFIASLGELGILHRIKAILMAYPKAQFCDRLPPEGSKVYIVTQQMAIKAALTDYNSELPVIFNMNFGHTDPQLIVPNGGIAVIDGTKKTISFESGNL